MSVVCHDADASTGEVEVPAELASSTRFVAVAPGSDFANAALAETGGRYLTFLDSRSRLSADYLATLQELVDAAPGRVVQLGVSESSEVVANELEDVLDGLPTVALDPLDLVTSVAFGAVPLDAYAIPRQACAANGLRFDPSAGDACPTMLVLEAVELCGIVRTGEKVVVVHPAVVRQLESQIEVLQKHLSLTSRLVPEGAGAQLLALREAAAERDELARELAAARDQVQTLSTHLHRMEPELIRLQDAESRRLTRRLRSKAGAVKRRLQARGLLGGSKP